MRPRRRGLCPGPAGKGETHAGKTLESQCFSHRCPRQDQTRRSKARLFPMTPQAKLLPVDLEHLPRAAAFRQFTQAVPCSFALTAPIDVTGAVRDHRETGASFYALMLHAILTAGNRLECFRWDWIDRENKVPGIWTGVGASFTVFHEETETFSTHWLSYEKDRAAFLAHYEETVRGGGNLDEPIPPNAVPVSMIPWVTYTGFQVNLPDSLYLRPVVTMGRYVQDKDRFVLPLTIQMHHAVGDGRHVAQAVSAIESVTGGRRTGAE